MNNPITPHIGRNIRDIRTRKGLTQKALAEMSHCAFDYIQSLECGYLGITPVRAYRISVALGCQVSELFRPEGA
jgi:transcriptional regulator with XRE-family HTH domain